MKYQQTQILDFERKAMTWEELIQYDTILRILVALGLYGWTIVSWFFGLYGMLRLTMQIFRLMNHDIVVNREDGKELRSYSGIPQRELTSTFFLLSVFAAWWVMMVT